MGLTASSLESAIRGVNISLGNLVIRDGEYQFNVKVQRDAQSVDDIRNAYLKINGRIFQIKYLARVIEHPQRLATIVRSDGKNAISLAVIKQSDARMSKLKKGIDELLGYFAKDYPDVEFTVTRDQTELLDYSINNLFQNIVLGIVLACLIIFMFMQNLRSAFLIALTMPIALILSMLFFYLIGISINIISLSGLVLGVGMMVDNSIIVIDNITFRWGSGYSLKDAIVKGTGEVFAPMLSSVLTTCAVFVPLIFLSGIAGALFYDQAMAVVITLFCALAATVTVIPVYFFLTFRRENKATTNRFIARYFNFGWFERWYERTLKFFFRRRWIIWTSFAVAAVGTVALFGVIRKERLPEMTYRDMLVNVDWNERVTIAENDRRVSELVDEIGPLAQQVTEMTGVQQFVLGHTRETGNSESVIYVNCAGGHNIEEVRAAVDRFMQARYPDAIFGFASSGNIFEEVFADREARLVARLRQTDGQAPDPERLEAVLNTIAAGLPGTEVAPVPWEEYLLFVGKPDVMALYNVTFNELSAVLRSSLNDNTLFTMMQGKFPVPVVVGENRTSLNEIMEGASVRRGGVDIPVGTFFRETRGQDLKYITSGTEGNFYPLEFDLPDRDIPETVEKIREIVRDNPDFEVSFSGAYFSNRGMAWEIIIVLLVAVMLLYFILAAQFESVVQPLVILSELVLDIFFTLVVLWVVDVSLNIMSLIGIVVTCGIVINDSILKVDTINQLRKNEGMGIIRAIMEGGRRRLKPIIMTSLTTMLAIAPFLVRGDMGSDLQYPLSVATIAGMTAGTLVSIFFVPLIYYSIYNGRRRKA
jgi:multidrug efflux pump subunit AcrB